MSLRETVLQLIDADPRPKRHIFTAAGLARNGYHMLKKQNKAGMHSQTAERLLDVLDHEIVVRKRGAVEVTDAEVTDAEVEEALEVWFASTKDGWKAAMRAVLENRQS